MSVQAPRAQQNIPLGTVLTFIVATGQVATQGYPAAFNATVGTVQNAGAGGRSFGTFLGSGAPGDRAAILVPGPVVKIKVGTGGATQGQWAVAVADGYTNAPTMGAGTTLRNICGIFMDTGNAGDDIGMIPVCAPSVST